MLTTNIYFDFGQAIGLGNSITTTTAGIRDIAGPGISSDGTPALGTGPNLSVIGSYPLNGTVDLEPFAYDYNNSGNITELDLELLAAAVVEKAQAALAPFDVQVLDVSNSSFAGINATLASNNVASQLGDAYVFLGNVFFHLDQRRSVGLLPGAVPFGIAASDDISAQMGNVQDEVSITILDKIQRVMEQWNSSLVRGTPEYNARLVQRIAYTALHEAFHTFTFVHSRDIVIEDGLSQGDVIAFEPTDSTRELPFIVTRFPLERAVPSGFPPIAQPDNYLLAKEVLGLRDEFNAAGQPGANGIPDVAYVTGTGAHDRITLTLGSPGVVNVLVQAYSDPAKTAGFLIDSYAYSINLATETDGPIWVDPSLGEDEVIVDPAIAADLVNPRAQVAILGDAPQVKGVVMGSSLGNHADHRVPAGSGEQIRTVPVGGMDTITIEFDEPVTAAAADVLSLEGLHTATANYVATRLSSFTGNGTTRLTWTFDAPLTTDQIVLRLDASRIKDDRLLELDGEWTNPYSVSDAASVVSTFPSGDGAAGGDFEFFFTVLFGDRDRSNQVNLSTDILPALANIGLAVSYGWAQGDFDGSGAVNLSPDVLPALANIDAAYFADWGGGPALRGASAASFGGNDDVARFRELMEQHGVTENGELVGSLTLAEWQEFVDEAYEMFDFEPLATAA